METGFCTKWVSFECLVSTKRFNLGFLVDEKCPRGFIEVLPLIFLFFLAL